MKDPLVVWLLGVTVLLCGVDTMLAVWLLRDNPQAELNPAVRWLIITDPSMSLAVLAKWAGTMSACGFVVAVRSASKRLGRIAAVASFLIMFAVVSYAMVF